MKKSSYFKSKRNSCDGSGFTLLYLADEMTEGVNGSFKLSQYSP